MNQVNNIILILEKNKKKLIFIPLIVLILSLIINIFFISPTYKATSELLINSNEQNNSTTDVDTNLRLIETYSHIIESPKVKEKVYTSLNKKYSYDQLDESLTVETNPNSQIISLNITGKSPKQVQKIVNSYAKESKIVIKELMGIDNVKVMTTAHYSDIKDPIKPKILLNSLVSVIISLLLIVIYLIIYNYFNAKVNTEEDIELHFKKPILGKIGKLSDFNKAINNHDIVSDKINDFQKNVGDLEDFRHIRINLQFQNVTNKCKTILVTSIEKNDGKTTIASNLAVASAMDGKKVLYINSDLRKNSKNQFGNDDEYWGLTDYLSSECEIENIIQKTSLNNLDVIYNGPLPPNPTELLSLNLIDNLLVEVQESYDLVILDAAPTFFSETQVLSNKVNGLLLIVQNGQTKLNNLQKEVSNLVRNKVNIIGFILNDKKKKKKENNYYYYY